MHVDFYILWSKSYYIFNSAFYESLGQEMVLSRLKHPDFLLVSLQIIKVLVKIDEETEW